MSDIGPARRARENAAGIASVLVTGVWLVALLAGQDWWLPFMLVGYVVVVPIVAMLFDEDSDPHHSTAGSEADRERGGPLEADGDEALQRLRERYAAGELTEAQFERKVERLLETETIEDAEDRRGTPTRERDGDTLTETE